MRRRITTIRALVRKAIAAAVLVAGCSIHSNTIHFRPVDAFASSIGGAIRGGDEDEPRNGVDPAIEEAIRMCRAKIAESDADHPSLYPKTRMRLAVMLHSVSKKEGKNHDEEILFLFETAATNETLSSSEQISAWTNAARFTPDPEVKRKVLSRALAVSSGDDDADKDEDEDEDEDSNDRAAQHTQAFGMYVRSLLQDCAKLTPQIHGDSESARSARTQLLGLLREGLDLCDYVEERLIPREPTVDVYRGVFLRKIYKSVSPTTSTATSVMILDAEGSMAKGAPTDNDGTGPLQVYAAYGAAASKSHSNTLRMVYGVELPYGSLPPPSGLTALADEVNAASIEDSCTELLHHVILAASAAREARSTTAEDEQLRFGTALIESELGDHIRKETKVEFWNAIGVSFKARGDSKTAARMFRRTLDVDPEDGHARVQLASLGDKAAASSTSLSADYVSGLFDGYSERFDHELVNILKYKGHIMVADAVKRHVPSSFAGSPWTMIDLGCGTGLLGSLFREFSPPDTTVWGADLSHRMVLQAQDRTIPNDDSNAQPVYDAVSEMEVVKYVAQLGINSAHVVGASDVLIYVGDLNELFRECHRVLLPDGLLAFTVEFPSPDETEASRHVAKHGVGLLKSGRFGHSRKYIEGLAREHGYNVLEWDEGVLRKQANEDVQGAVAVLRKQL